MKFEAVIGLEVHSQLKTKTKLLNRGEHLLNCLLFTSDAADEGLGVDLGGRRIII